MADEEECISKGLKIEGGTESLIKKWDDSEEKLNDFVSSLSGNEAEFLKKAPTFINELTNSTTIIGNIVKKLEKDGHQEICCEHYMDFFEWFLKNRPGEFRGEMDKDAWTRTVIDQTTGKKEVKGWLGNEKELEIGSMQKFNNKIPYKLKHMAERLKKEKEEREKEGKVESQEEKTNRLNQEEIEKKIITDFNKYAKERKELFIKLLNAIIKELMFFKTSPNTLKIPGDAENKDVDILTAGQQDNMMKVCGKGYEDDNFLGIFIKLRQLCIDNLKYKMEKGVDPIKKAKYTEFLTLLSSDAQQKGGKRRRKKSRKRRRKTRRKRKTKRRRKTRRKRTTKRRRRKR